MLWSNGGIILCVGRVFILRMKMMRIIRTNILHIRSYNYVVLTSSSTDSPGFFLNELKLEHSF